MKTKVAFLMSLLSAAAPALAQPLRLGELIHSAGIAILPIVGLSILALAVTIERIRRCRKDAIVPRGLLEQLAPSLRKGDFHMVEQQLKTSAMCWDARSCIS